MENYESWYKIYYKVYFKNALRKFVDMKYLTKKQLQFQYIDYGISNKE